jgi:hypothetical protein
MLEKIIDYLKKKGWNFTHGKDGNILFFPISGFNAIFNCVLDVTNDNFFFLFITFNGTNCPLDKRLPLSELFTRLNNKLKYGNFEMGIDTGEIKFRTCICFEEMDINEKIIENVILKNIFIHDSSFPSISKFLFGDLTQNEVYNNLFPSTLVEDNHVELIEEKINDNS